MKKNKRKNEIGKIIARVLALLLALFLVIGACLPSFAEGSRDKSVTVAVTNTMTSLNPLLMDFSETGKYATALAFLPLVELNRDLEFVGQLAESITTEDNLTFTITLNENAAWSDGTPVTTADVMFTFLCMASPEAGNLSMNMYTIVGVSDEGVTESGATEI
jgi:peptide/nickel transport system substrate-binding protein